MAKEKSSPAAVLPHAEQESELGRLREILYGSQARATNERLTELEQRLDVARQELAETIRDLVGQLDLATTRSIEETRVELVQVVERQEETQSADLSGLRDELSQRVQVAHESQAEALRQTEAALSARLDSLRDETSEALRATRNELQDQTSRSLAELTDRVLQVQREARQRDEELRQELLNLTDRLEDRKTSRADLGQLLVELGDRIRGAGAEGAESDGSANASKHTATQPA